MCVCEERDGRRMFLALIPMEWDGTGQDGMGWDE